MGNKTGIEWTDATWNPVTGCSKVSQGCKNCYAEALFHRPYPGRKFTDVRIHPERLDWPLRWRGSPKAKAEGRPSRIFVNSMSDLFHDHVPMNFIAAVYLAAAMRPDLIFQILTKRAENMLSFNMQKKAYLHTLLKNGIWRGAERGDTNLLVNLPQEMEMKLRLVDGDPALDESLPNVWLGVSVEDQQTADERIPLLLQTPAVVRFVSYEPALGPVDLSPFFPLDLTLPSDTSLSHNKWRKIGVDWIIAGGESGPHARPAHPDWFRSVRDQCQADGVPFFFKQWGAWKAVGDDEPLSKTDLVVSCNGSSHSILHGWPARPLGQMMRFVGKKDSGRLLDGREWKEFPKTWE
ncbi:MAG: phage Gp37/Gp68 family protein [Patescibacteria group bacterium]|nr:phage Gp37/Gp68 family protein [Patescibacteria group bacterium]